MVAGALLLWSPAAGAEPRAGQGAPITVIVKGLRFGGGSVRIDICTATTFLKAGCPFSGAAPAVEGTTAVTVAAVPPGEYAVQAYHDFNDNHRVDRNALGVPEEAIAFSNDAPLGLHGPSFARSRFMHGAAPQTLTVKLHHFGGRPKGAGPARGDWPD